MKVDTNIIAKVLADREATLVRLHDEYAGMGMADFKKRMDTLGSELYDLTDRLADAIKAEHPRFNAGRFQIDANPIRSEKLKQRILANIGD